MPYRTRFLLNAVLALAIAIPAARAANHFSAGLQKIQALAGDWEGKDAEGHPARTTFKVIAGETAVMETLTMSGMEEMVTLYSDEGDGIALLHYCPTNNRPQMRAVPPAGEIKELDFRFQGLLGDLTPRAAAASDVPDVAIGHEHRLVMQFQDKDHITERWTWRKNGKDTETVYQFTRKAAN